MHRRTRTLSIDDQKAIDVCLDHAASAGNKARITRIVASVQQRRLTAATSWLLLLSEMPEVDPPSDLVARTMQLIDRHQSGEMTRHAPASAANVLPLH